MAQFDFYRYTGPNASIAFLLDVQSDLLRDLATRVVVPLVLLDAFGPPMKRLHPVFTIEDKEYVMATTEIAGTLTRNLGSHAGSLETRRLDIRGAIDFLQEGC
jgi:toxin CcdB